MALELDKIQFSDFEPLIGETFKLGEYEVELQSVDKGSETPDEYRESFTLKFSTPEGCNFRSEVMTLSHDKIGEHDLLATQVTGWGDPSNIEICFA